MASATKLRLVFLTTGRFHVFDQVRELIKLGHDVTIYTLVPPSRGIIFGIPRKHLVWIALRVPFQMILYMLLRKTRLSKGVNRMINGAVDRKMAQIMPNCDAFISMSGICVHSLKIARNRKILTILQRSSRHIESQADILRAAPDGEQVAKWEVDRELEEYVTADYITVLSQHSVESFVERGVPREKLFRLIPGVDLSQFNIMNKEVGYPPTIIFAGTWSIQKGCDLLVEAWREIKESWRGSLRLMHVGNRGDLEYPEDDGFVHVKRVDQSVLPKYYGQADVFCLPSRQDGFGVVLLQALACGLRLVCSDRTGGPDVLKELGKNNAVRVFRSGDVADLVVNLREALESSCNTEHVDFLASNRESFSWKSHAKSLADFVSNHL